MDTKRLTLRFPVRRLPLVLFAAAALAVPCAAVEAARSINERRPVEAAGSIDIIDPAGSVEIAGWDQPVLEVTGTLGDGVERVEVTVNGARSVVKVVLQKDSGWNASGEARLVVHVPRRSSVSAALVSADLKVSHLEGMATLQTVSGDVEGDVGQNVQVSVVSGEVRLVAANARAINVRSISGDVTVTGGGGDVDVSTVSGDIDLTLATVRRGRLKTVSGELKASLALADDGQLDGESVSGDIDVKFQAAPVADFALQTFSGEISNCFGPKPEEPPYGPGSRLVFRNGAATGHVRLETKSGDIDICAKDTRGSRAVDWSPPRSGAGPRYAVVV